MTLDLHDEPLKVRYWRFRAWLWSRFHGLGFNPWRVRIGEWQAEHGRTLTATEAFRRIRHRITTSQGDTDGNPLP